MRRIKWVWICMVVFFMVLLPVYPSSVCADDPTARSIMEKVENRDDGDNRTAEMEMVLIDKNNNKRIRKIATFSRDFGEDTYNLMFFIHPADVKDTSFLTYDYDDPEKDDDQWLYLPALKKTKRIASSDKSGSFMGSDLNYSDMTSRNLDDYDYTLKKEMEVRGHKAWLIESVPRNRDVIEETGYTKSLLIVRQDIYMVVRAVSWEKDGGALKYMDLTNIEKIDGIWVWTEMLVTRKIGKQTVHQTELRLNNVKFGQELSEDLFTTRRMEKGL